MCTKNYAVSVKGNPVGGVGTSTMVAWRLLNTWMFGKLRSSTILTTGEDILQRPYKSVHSDVIKTARRLICVTFLLSQTPFLINFVKPLLQCCINQFSCPNNFQTVRILDGMRPEMMARPRNDKGRQLIIRRPQQGQFGPRIHITIDAHDTCGGQMQSPVVLLRFLDSPGDAARRHTKGALTNLQVLVEWMQSTTVGALTVYRTRLVETKFGLY